MWPDILGVLAATIASFVIGAVWYSPPVFGKMWMTLLKMTEEDARKRRNKAIVVGFFANLLTAYLLGVFVLFAGASDLVAGAEVAFLAWLAFAFSYHLTGWVFENRPPKLFGIDVVHSLIIFLVMGAILGVWG